jgi:hypothetical protein
MALAKRDVPLGFRQMSKKLLSAIHAPSIEMQAGARLVSLVPVCPCSAQQ